MVVKSNTSEVSFKSTVNTELAVDEKLNSLKLQLKNTETWLLASESRVRTLIQLIPDGLLIVNGEGRIEAANPCALNLFACEYKGIIGRNFSSFFRQDKGEAKVELKVNDNVLKVYAIRFDQSEFPAHLQIRIFAESPELQYIVFVEDVSREVELERVKQEFVAMVTHDIRTPLASTRNVFDLLEAGLLGSLNEKGHAVAKRIRASCDQTLRLLNDLLDLEKMQAGKFNLEYRCFSIPSMLKRSVDLVQALAEQRNIKVELESADIECRADEDRLIQVVVNLLSNAIKYSPDDMPIKLSGEFVDNAILVSVSDLGRGIPQDKVDKIFSRYEQVEIDDSKAKGGVGLGLAICESIVREHKGEIGVKSSPGEGSCFWFKIPQALDDL